MEKREKREKRMTVFGYAVLIVIAVATVALVIFGVVQAARALFGEDTNAPQTDAQKLLGTWVEETGGWRFTFDEENVTIEKKSGEAYLTQGARQYTLNDRTGVLLMAAVDGKVDSYTYLLNGDSLTLTYREGGAASRTWEFVREK